MALSPIIHLKNVHYTYQPDSGQAVKALAGIDLAVQTGEYLTILGHNGSGKSTLAKHLNGLLLPTEGEVWVKTWNTKEPRHLRDIRSTVGMVFQNPDNQLVATIVEEDVAFGPENLGLAHPEIVRRVAWSLEQVSMQAFRRRSPHLLSSGQKQRICLAGMLAMQPEVLVLDEATAMLDPLGRREVLEIAHRLNREQGVTVIAITHFMEEAVDADRVVVLAGGRIVLQGPPSAVFGQAEQLRQWQMDVPPITQLALALRQRLADFPQDILQADAFVAAIRQRHPRQNGRPKPAQTPQEVSSAGNVFDPQPAAANQNGVTVPPEIEPVIRAKNLSHYYMRDTPLQVQAVTEVNLEIYRGEILGIIGHTGSGKSTIIQHFNALLRPHAGQVVIFGQDANAKQLDVKNIRARVGLVFQQPETQLFEHYVGDDIAYGPRNLKLSREEVRARVKRAMESVGLGFAEFKDRLTFSLSGGEMRRVALAGVLALEPEVLVLDEPTAGLDPQGRQQLLAYILQRQREQNLTLVLVSHNMEELARVCDRICVVSSGQVVLTGPPAEVFGRPQILRDFGLDAPAVTDAVARLRDAGLIEQTDTALTVEQAVEILANIL
ncbi:MAG: energy-coupling factor transporter ATPase [Anaerolineae bacterium]|nr:energy-coupling factor transporter ATPase [Anaerolineae bacterium]